jgi:hypothetical protein
MEFLDILGRVTSSFNHVSFSLFFVDHFPDSEDSGSRIRIPQAQFNPLAIRIRNRNTACTSRTFMVLILLPFRTLYHICNCIPLTVHVAIPVLPVFAGMKILCHVYFDTKKRQLLFAMLTFRSSLKKNGNNPETRKS